MTRELPQTAMKPKANQPSRPRGTCEAFEARMNQWIDLGEEHDIERDLHLLECSRCQQTLQIWRQLESGLKSTAVQHSSRKQKSGGRKLFRQGVLPAWAMAIGACVMAVIILRTPSTQMTAFTVDSASIDPSVEVELDPRSSDRERLSSEANRAVESSRQGFAVAAAASDEVASTAELISDLRTEGRMAANLQWDRWRIASSEPPTTTPKTPTESASGQSADAEAGGHSVLLARWIANSRPTMAQLSTGVAPLGRTLQRTANLFY